VLREGLDEDFEGSHQLIVAYLVHELEQLVEQLRQHGLNDGKDRLSRDPLILVIDQVP